MVNINDYVTVIFARNDLFSFQKSPKIPHCEVLHIPQDVGDNYHFKYEDAEFWVNPVSAEFIGIVKEATDE